LADRKSLSRFSKLRKKIRVLKINKFSLKHYLIYYFVI